jgi:tetratricopeptide (TPR) repeat protein
LESKLQRKIVEVVSFAMASNVPKFASFRPKPKAAPEPPKEPQQREKDDKSSKEKVPRKRRSPSPPRNARTQESSTDRPYFSDRRGDPDVLRYGSMNRYDIPPYRRFGHGFILGLSAYQKIDREQSTDRKILVTPATRRRQERLLTSKRANKSNDRALRLLKAEIPDRDLSQDFVPFSTNFKRKRDDSDEEDDEMEPETDYRGIGEPKSTDPVDPDTHYESDPEVVIDTEVTRKHSQLVRQTKEHPEDIQSWLALIEHQEAMLKLERPSAELTASDKVHLADIRISTYEEALKKIGSDQNSKLQLYKGLLKEAERAWDGAKLASKWKDVLAKHPQSLDLWMVYLDFVQSRFTSFKYEDCRAIFFKCNESLRTNKSEISPEQSLHVLLRLTSMAHDAGYQELALAVWQALLEYHLLRPEVGADLKPFEEFWESEVSRIGEPGAKGWKHSNTDDAIPPGPSSLHEKEASDATFEDFRKREVEATSILRLPGRTSDDVAEDDAFHTIFFSDIEPYLNIITPETPATLIIEAFLCFCGLPPLSHRSPHRRSWWPDPFLQRHWNSATPETEDTTGFTKAIKRFSNYSAKSFQMTTELLFDHSFSLESIRLDEEFIRRLLKLLASNLPSEDIVGEYLLAFESKHFPLEAFKTAKRLLKARPSSLRLYNAYGLVESRLGNSAKADQVFSMALSMQKGDDVLSTPWSLELFNNWVWEALRRGEHGKALWRLVSPRGSLPAGATKDSQPDTTLLETVHLTLSQTSEHALLHHDYPTAILSTSLLALLAYLTHNHSAPHALTLHANLTSYLTSHRLSTTPTAELHAQSIVTLLTHHTTHAPIVKPSLIRTTLEPLISTFPTNTLLLALYAANEARFSIDDRVRGIMHQTSLHTSEEKSLPAWAFAIHYETLKGEIAGSTSHSIRALYKRATESTVGSRCPALWEAYVRFEMQCLGEEVARQRTGRRPRRDAKKSRWEVRVEEAEERVKETFFAGLRKLPWCKEYIMLAFTDAQGVFGEEEKAKLYRVMLEKELRFYVELDGVDA